jgi:glutathione S-transferase
MVELVASGIQPLQNLSVLQHLSEDEVVRLAWATHFNQRGLSALEALLAGLAGEAPGRHIWGDDLTAADLFLVPQVAAARRFGIELSPYPLCLAKEQAALGTPAAEAARGWR